MRRDGARRARRRTNVPGRVMSGQLLALQTFATKIARITTVRVPEGGCLDDAQAKGLLMRSKGDGRSGMRHVVRPMGDRKPQSTLVGRRRNCAVIGTKWQSKEANSLLVAC